MSETFALEIEGLFRSFGSHAVLTNVSWRVPTGAVVGVLGRNGCGKTTLLQAAVGLLRADAGRVRLLGEDVRDLSDAAKGRLGYVPQRPVLPPRMTVTNLCRHHAALYPRWDEVLVNALLRRFGIDRGAKVGALSLGHQQSLALALALGPHPAVLILDEPAASLDPVARRVFHDTVLEVACDGQRTVILSTHLTADIERLANRLLILANGQTLYDGGLDDLQATTKRLRLRAERPLGRPAWTEVRSWRAEGSIAVAVIQGDVAAVVERAQRLLGAEVIVDDLTLENILVEVHP